MKKQRIQSNILFILGIGLAVVIAFFAFVAKDCAPVMVQYPAAALKRVEVMMNAIRAGDFAGASKIMYGTPSMGQVPATDNLAVELIWSEFLSSIEYEITGECYASQSGVVADVTIRTLDVPGVIRGMEGYAEEQLNKRIASAKDLEEIYDSDDNIHPQIMNTILWNAALQSLENNREYLEKTISLNLIFENGEWWIQPDEALQKILSGSF